MNENKMILKNEKLKFLFHKITRPFLELYFVTEI
jgi:hypothetical protein